MALPHWTFTNASFCSSQSRAASHLLIHQQPRPDLPPWKVLVSSVTHALARYDYLVLFTFKFGVDEAFSHSVLRKHLEIIKYHSYISTSYL